MKSRWVAVSLLTMLAATAFAAPDAQQSFDQIKKFSGSWEGKTSAGMPVQFSFRVTARGSAVMSEIMGMEDDNMISMFNLDGQRLLMTHYCSAGNQPRMTATSSADGKTIAFDFLDATNVAGPEAGHMQHVVISVLDPDHHTEEWNYLDHGKEMKQVFDLRRKK